MVVGGGDSTPRNTLTTCCSRLFGRDHDGRRRWSSIDTNACSFNVGVRREIERPAGKHVVLVGEHGRVVGETVVVVARVAARARATTREEHDAFHFFVVEEVVERPQAAVLSARIRCQVRIVAFIFRLFILFI